MGGTPHIAESREQDDRGHRTVPHTADLRIEAWGPTREDCLAEAVRGLVDSFAVVAGRPLHGRAKRYLTARSDEGLLVGVVDEVIYWLDVGGGIPASIAVQPALDGGVVVVLLLVQAADAEIIGPAPKAATWHDLRCAPDAAGRWTCAVTVDV
jgi:SHS2 domain-containing protein